MSYCFIISVPLWQDGKSSRVRQVEAINNVIAVFDIVILRPSCVELAELRSAERDVAHGSIPGGKATDPLPILS